MEDSIDTATKHYAKYQPEYLKEASRKLEEMYRQLLHKCPSVGINDYKKTSERLVPPGGIGPPTSSLPMMCSTTEPWRHMLHTARKHVILSS